MTLENNQNTESISGFSAEYEQRKEQQNLILDQIAQLKSLEKSLSNSETEKNADQIQISSFLEELERKVSALDLKNQETFDLNVQKVQEQLDQIKTSRRQLDSLKKETQSFTAKIAARVDAQLPDHDPMANQSRAESVERIQNIKPQAGESSIANWAASRIQKLVS